MTRYRCSLTKRLQEFKDSQSLFGGINVLLFGDLMQLPPVSRTSGSSHCFYQPESRSSEPHLWRMFRFCELTQNMRQTGDNSFVELLNSLHVGELRMDQLEILDSRRIPLVGDFEDGAAVRIFPTTKKINQYNEKICEKLVRSTKLYTINAVRNRRLLHGN